MPEKPGYEELEQRVKELEKVNQERRAMNPKRSPIHKKRNRNVLCPYYGDCLDYAIENSWAYWGCSDCEHRLSQGGRPETQLTVDDDSIAYYDLPLEIYREL